MKNWLVNGQEYYPNHHDNVIDLPVGTYRTCFNERLGGTGLELVTSASDNRYKLPSKAFDIFMKEMHIFLKSREQYARYGFTWKRGALLYGSPGNGKSVLIEAITDEIKAMDGIAVIMNHPGHLHQIISMLSAIRNQNPDRFMLVVMEELDLLLEGLERSDRSTFLNLLDGGMSIDKVLYLATTNAPDKLTENIYNRPSRFDLRILVENPDLEMIKAYLEAALLDEDKETYPDLNALALKLHMANVSLAGLKEFVIAHFIIGNTVEEALAKLQDFKYVPELKKNRQMGFSGNTYGEAVAPVPSKSLYANGR